MNDNISVKVVFVTPDMARAFLANNPRNRNLNLRSVTTLARAIRNKEWQLNGEAAKISRNGDVLDGQHRFAAIIEAGQGIEMVLVEGLEPETQDTMDSGRKRSTADVFRINGHGNANVLASVTRRAVQWEAGNLKFSNTVQNTTAELKVFLEKNPTLHRSAEIGTTTNTAFADANATVTGTAHHILHNVDQDTAALFFARLKSGAELGVDDPILTLRTRLTRNRTTAKHVPFHLGVALYIRAWNAMREGRTLQVIIHTADEPMIRPI